MVAFSVNTNEGALNALRNLSIAAAELGAVQTRINTGLKVSSAKDNAAIFAIAQNLRADLKGVNAVRGSLDRGSSVLDVTISAAETISDLLIELQELAVAANDTGLDARSRTALNEQFQAVLAQIDSVAAQATFNGANLLNDTPDTLNVVVGFDGNGLIDTIDVRGVDLTADSVSATTTDPTLMQLKDVESLADMNNLASVVKAALAESDAPEAAFDDVTGEYDFAQFTATFDNTAAGGGDTLRMTVVLGGKTVIFEATGDFGDGAAGEVADPTSIGFQSLTLEDFKVVSVDGDGTQTKFTSIIKGSDILGTRTDLLIVKLADLDLTDDFFAAASIQVVANMLQNVNSILAKFGAVSRQISLQDRFASELSDALEVGIGNLVDADLARESANLQALQVKQQLGIQALGIANQAPQSILQLFQ